MTLGPEEESTPAEGLAGLGGNQFGKLVTMTAGVLPDLPKYLLKLRRVFALKPDESMANELENIITTAYESKVPIEQLVGEIFSLGEEFARVGITTKESTMLMGKFADAVGSSQLPMQMVIDFARQTMAELTTAGGVEKLFMAAHFTTEAIRAGTLSEGTVDVLNKVSQKRFGEDFVNLKNVGQKAGIFEAINVKEYGNVRGEVFKDLILAIQSQTGGEFGMGGQIAKVLSTILTGQEWKGFLPAASAERGGKADKFTDALAEGDELLISAKRKDFEIYAATVARANKEWYAGIAAEYEKFSGQFMLLMSELTGRNMDMIGVAIKTRLHMEQLQKIWTTLGIGDLPKEEQVAALLAGPGGTKALDFFQDKAYSTLVQAKRTEEISPWIKTIEDIASMGYGASSVDYEHLAAPEGTTFPFRLDAGDGKFVELYITGRILDSDLTKVGATGNAAGDN